MNKAELSTLIFSLNEKENFYKNNPGFVSSFYKSLRKKVTSLGELYIISFESELKKKGNLLIKNDTFTNQFQIVRQNRYTSVPLHIHDYIEMNIVYSGTVRSTIKDKEIVLFPGDVSILSNEVPHTFLPLGENDIVINLLMQKDFFNSSMLSRLSTNSIISDFLVKAISQFQQKDEFIIFNCGESPVFTTIVENLLCEYYEPGVCSKEIIDAYMILIFSELLKSFQKREALQSEIYEKTYVGKIIQYIEKNYKVCTLKSTADNFGFHPNYLSRYLKEQTGNNFKELVQTQKMNQASFLLVNSDLTIETICREIGYQNLGFFYHKFFLKYQMTPKEYRQALKI